MCWILVNCRLRDGQAPKCCAEALLPGGPRDVGTVRWWVDPGVEEEHTCPNTSCDRGSPSLGPVALEFSLLLPETVCTGLASVALAASKTTSWSWCAQEQGLAHSLADSLLASCRAGSHPLPVCCGEGSLTSAQAPRPHMLWKLRSSGPRLSSHCLFPFQEPCPLPLETVNGHQLLAELLCCFFWRWSRFSDHTATLCC